MSHTDKLRTGAATKAYTALTAKLKKTSAKNRGAKIAAIEAALAQVRHSKKEKLVKNMLRREKDAICDRAVDTLITKLKP